MVMKAEVFLPRESLGEGVRRQICADGAKYLFAKLGSVVELRVGLLPSLRVMGGVDINGHWPGLNMILFALSCPTLL